MNNQLNIVGLKHGLIIGLVSAILSTCLYLLDAQLFIGLSGIMIISTSIVILVKLGRIERELHAPNGLSYFAAFVYASIAIFIAGLMSETVYITICSQDKGLQEIMIAANEEASEIIFDFLNLKGIEAEEKRIEMEATLKASFNYYSLISNGRIILFRALMIGAFAALFLKKEVDSTEHE